MNDEIFWNNLGRYFAGELSNAEMQQMQQHIETDAELKQIVSQLKIIWEAHPDRKQWNADKAWEKVSAKTVRQPSPAPVFYIQKSWKQFGMAAASIAAAILIAVLLIWQPGSWNTIPYENIDARFVFATMKGEREQQTLPDGTKVYLNADSKVIVPEGFLEEKRFVYLIGEAYFEVTDHEDLPFIVYNAGFFTIATEQASFNVKAFPELNEVTLSVKEGETCVTKVKASDERAPDVLPLIKLRPAKQVKSHQVIAFNKKSDSFDTVEKKNMKEFFGWRKGILYFDESAPEVWIRKIERWYGVDIKYNACVLMDEQMYSGEFDNADLKKVLQYLSAKMDIQFSIQGNNIFLSRKC